MVLPVSLKKKQKQIIIHEQNSHSLHNFFFIIINANCLLYLVGQCL